MNDTPDSGAPRLVSRRTVAKTAAWAAPAIALAAASPAHAASQAKNSTGAIEIPQGLYSVPRGGAIPVSGTLTPTDGGTLPADFTLTVECPNGFMMSSEDIAIAYTPSGITFTFWVSAIAGADSGTLTVSSNYPATSWTPASTKLEKPPIVVLPEGSPRIFFSWEDEYYTVVPKGDGFSGFHTVTGQVRVPEGTQLPANMQLSVQNQTTNWSIVGAPANELVVDVTPAGTFSFDVVQLVDHSHFGYFSVFWASERIPQMASCIVGDWTQPRPDNWNDMKPAGWDDLWG